MKFLSVKKVLTAAVAATTLASAVSLPAEAFTFGNDGILFDKDTTVNFDFLYSQGKYQSKVGIFEVVGGTTSFVQWLLKEDLKAFDSTANDFKGTCGVSVSVCNVAYTFKAGVEYALGITPTGQPKTNEFLFSTNTLNPVDSITGQLQTLFTSIAPGQFKIAFEDNGWVENGTRDYNDFVFTAAVVPVPEPTVLLGLGLVGGAIATTRRRKSQAS
ncbi:PEP-CTERM sorting domain-containing protein [Geitlerinema splendidum]|nr:PEP-CTERM sorting domain-containing protein [Geitlerinema splendidum]